MGTTANRAIPYVEPADTVQTYPAADKAKADRLDALLFDTGWVPITISPGFAAKSDALPQVRRIGSVIYTRGAWTNTGLAVNGSHGVGTLPAGFAPETPFYVPAGTGAGAQTGVFVIGSGSAPYLGIQLRPGAALSTNYYMTTDYFPPPS